VHIEGTLLQTRGMLKLKNIILLEFDTCDWPERSTIGLRIRHTQKKNNSWFGWPNTCFGYKDTTGKGRDLVIFKDKPKNNHIKLRGLDEIFSLI